MKLQINKEDQKKDVYSITNVAGIKSENKVSPNEKEYYISLVRISIIKYQKNDPKNKKFTTCMLQ